MDSLVDRRSLCRPEPFAADSVEGAAERPLMDSLFVFIQSADRKESRSALSAMFHGVAFKDTALALCRCWPEGAARVLVLSVFFVLHQFVAIGEYSQTAMASMEFSRADSVVALDGVGRVSYCLPTETGDGGGRCMVLVVGLVQWLRMKRDTIGTVRERLKRIEYRSDRECCRRLPYYPPAGTARCSSGSHRIIWPSVCG